MADPASCAVGVSLAGPVSPRSEVVRVSPFLDWSDVPLVDLIRQSTGLPTVVENDVRALTAAEHWFGAAAGCSDFALGTIGSGVACGIVMNDRLIDGASGGSGQIGHLPITEWGPLCERGHRGCVRSYLASTAIVGQVSAQLGRQTTYAEILELAAADHPVARRVVNEAGRALGTVIGTIAAITAPSKVLVSGEGVGLAPLVMDIVREHAHAVQHWTLPDVPIEIAPFTFTEWAKGAAVIALRTQLDATVGADT
jgi:predicted NBD/HSP70 family sugar kinase